jgi:hypothetical protein
VIKPLNASLRSQRGGVRPRCRVYLFCMGQSTSTGIIDMLVSRDGI